jgi:hypothetical protein
VFHVLPSSLRQRGVEEPHDPALVLLRGGVESARVTGVRDLPTLHLRAADLVVVDVVGALGSPLRVASVDERMGCLIFATRSPRAGGGVWPEYTVTARAIGRYEIDSAPATSRTSRYERLPAPSDTTARSAGVSAAVSSSISPPTESPMPPMRSGSTSWRDRRYSIAAFTSRSPSHP